MCETKKKAKDFSIFQINVSTFIGDCITAQTKTTAIMMAILFVHVNHLAIKKDGVVVDRKILMMVGDVQNPIKIKRLMNGQKHVNVGTAI